MSSAAPFLAFSPSHLTVLALSGLAIVLLGVLRRWHPGMAVVGERVLGTLLLLTWPASALGHVLGGDFSRDNALPLHFCDVAAISGGIALWTGNRLACEILYFFGLAGTLQGLITPNLRVDFPDTRFFAFFMTHAGVVIAAIHVVTFMRCPPRAGAVGRMFAITMLYAGVAGLINQVLSCNYGFLCQKPETASLMDHLGAWPWYIASMIGLCIVFYTILNLPFVIQRRWTAKTGA